MITGDRHYVLMSPTPPYWPIDIEAPILEVPANSSLWEFAAKSDHVATSFSLEINKQDKADADKALRRLRSGKYGAGIEALFTDEWRDSHPEWSESERDASLVFCGTHFLRDHPRAREVLFALLWATGWPQDPGRLHPKHNPVQYVAITVKNGLEERQRRDEERRSLLAPKLGNDTQQRTVIDAKLVSGDIDSGILTFAAFASVDEFTRPDGWRRLPVDDIGSVYGVTREAVRQHLAALQRRGCIERKIETNSYDGSWRKDSLVRLL